MLNRQKHCYTYSFVTSKTFVYVEDDTGGKELISKTAV